MLTGTLATGFWVARYFGKGAGLLASSMFASLPPILGYAGVATTDLAITAMIPAAILTLEQWIDLPSPSRAALLGLVVGVGALSKFSFLLFFPIGCAIVIGTRFLRKTGAFSAKSLSLAIIVAAGAMRVRGVCRLNVMAHQSSALIRNGIARLVFRRQSACSS